MDNRKKSLSGAMNVLENLKTVSDYASQFASKKTEQDNNSKFQPLENIYLVEPRYIKNWELNDRPESELGDIESLASEFLEIGQQNPCIVRPIENSEIYQYELIAGERRWRAAIKANIKLKIIVKILSDIEAALIQTAENSHRKDLSDYAKGLNYSKLINNGLITQTELIKKLNLNKVYVSRLLSFRDIPCEIVMTIGDMTKISARTASTIATLSKKGSTYIEAIKHYAPLLKDGKIGYEKLTKLVESYITKKENIENKNFKFYFEDEKYIFQWKINNNKLTINFPKQLTNMLNKKQIKIEELTDEIKKYLQSKISNIDSS